MDEGVAAGDPRAMDAVERHRLLIDAWFYPCSREMHAQLGRMYVADPRFTATYEKIRPGMAQYVCDAIAANASGRVRGLTAAAGGRRATARPYWYVWPSWWIHPAPCTPSGSRCVQWIVPPSPLHS